MEETFLTPRTFGVVIYQFVGSLLLLFSFLMLIPTVDSFINWSSKDFLIGSVLTGPPFILGVLIIYVSQKYRSRVVVDLEQALLTVKKRGRPDEVYDLKEINEFVLKEELYPMPGFRQVEIAAKGDNERTVRLFSADIVLLARKWDRFSQKLASLTRKPMKKMSLIENLNGKLSSCGNE